MSTMDNRTATVAQIYYAYISLTYSIFNWLLNELNKATVIRRKRGQSPLLEIHGKINCLAENGSVCFRVFPWQGS